MEDLDTDCTAKQQDFEKKAEAAETSANPSRRILRELQAAKQACQTVTAVCQRYQALVVNI